MLLHRLYKRPIYYRYVCIYGKWKCIWQNVCIEVLPILNVYSIMYSEKLVLVVFMYSADWWYRRSKGSLLVLHTYIYIYVKRNAMWTGSECARSEVNTFTKYWQIWANSCGSQPVIQRNCQLICCESKSGTMLYFDTSLQVKCDFWT